MEMNNFDLTPLRNEEHFKFLTDFKTRVEEATPAALFITELYSEFLPLYADEDKALEYIRGSAITENIGVADKRFNNVFTGFRGTVKQATKHFNPAKQQAAKNIWVVLNKYGIISDMPYLQQTGAATNLLEELAANHAASISLIHVDDYVAQLAVENDAVSNLMSSRIDESSVKTLLRMKEVRIQVGAVYKKIVERINSGINFNGPAGYESFVRKMNEIIDYNANTLALRKGRSASGEEPGSGEGEVNEGNDVKINPLP